MDAYKIDEQNLCRSKYYLKMVIAEAEAILHYLCPFEKPDIDPSTPIGMVPPPQMTPEDNAFVAEKIYDEFTHLFADAQRSVDLLLGEQVEEAASVDQDGDADDEGDNDVRESDPIPDRDSGDNFDPYS